MATQTKNKPKADEQPADQEQREDEDIEQRRPPSASIVYETIRREGEDELERPSMSLAFSGLAAGLSMSFSLIASAVLYASLPVAPWRELVVPLGYTVGFIIVILGRQQLFTENTLTPILPLLAKPTRQMTTDVARLWAIVLVANIAGAFVAALLIAYTTAFGPGIHEAMLAVSGAACCTPFWTTFVHAVFAGWLIALMVWLLPAAEQSRLWIIMLITYLVSASHFSHIIAGSVEMFYAVFKGMYTWSQFWGSFFVPTLLGNIAGGLVLVAALNYGQIVAERNQDGAPGSGKA
jgi:formate/nitrite transporter FocA (FNT family)